MDLLHETFEFDYNAGAINYGKGTVGDLQITLDRLGLERALVVCGQTVGSTADVINPVTDGLGDRLVGIFNRTTPKKPFHVACAGADTVDELDVDVLVSLGGGSSLDVTKVISVIASGDRSVNEIAEEIEADGKISVPSKSLVPIVAIPTTLAGADLSIAGGVSLEPRRRDDPPYGRVANPRLMPEALFYDPNLFFTTPTKILCSSAMNGFDKGIEMLYSRNASPITDATAIHGLSILREGLSDLITHSMEAIERAITGIILVEYGLFAKSGNNHSVIHAFGHALREAYDIQQGTAHAIAAPHALRYIFESVDGRRDLLARALGVERADNRADAVIDVVVELRDSLNLPSRLRDVGGSDLEDIPDLADWVLNDPIITNAPEDLDLTQQRIEEAFHDTW